jgi:hypothetical protein
MPPKRHPRSPKPNARPVPTRRDPQSPDEWQDAVDAADLLLLLDACRQYGLVEGGPEVNIARCNELLAEGAERGIFPSSPDRRRFGIAAWLAHERTRLGLVQRVIAERMRTNTVRVSNIECGRVTIDDGELARLRAALKEST